MRKETALITGASRGLGLELARIFAREGYDLVLVARSADRLLALKDELEAAHGIRAAVFACDLSIKGAAAAVHDFTRAQGLDIDVLVNNAGFGDFGAFADCDWPKQYEMVQLNITALMQLTHCYLPAMLERGRGRILNLASVASFQPGPLMSVYYASKAFVLSFTEALSVELKNSGVYVTALCPGPTRTGFEERAGMGASGLFKHLRPDGARRVAEYGYRQLQKGRVIAVPGGVNKLAPFFSRIAPRRVIRHFVWRLQKTRTEKGKRS
jgi:short-subunit dehydrogenase